MCLVVYNNVFLVALDVGVVGVAAAVFSMRTLPLRHCSLVLVRVAACWGVKVIRVVCVGQKSVGVASVLPGGLERGDVGQHN